MEDKVWVDEPEGAPFEVYTVLGDSDSRYGDVRQCLLPEAAPQARAESTVLELAESDSLLLSFGRARGGNMGGGDGRGWRVYDDPGDFPPFLCPRCLSANTWTEPVAVLASGATIGFAEGLRACVDCWSRLVE